MGYLYIPFFQGRSFQDRGRFDKWLKVGFADVLQEIESLLIISYRSGPKQGQWRELNVAVGSH